MWYTGTARIPWQFYGRPLMIVNNNSYILTYKYRFLKWSYGQNLEKLNNNKLSLYNLKDRCFFCIY